jgi:hypothetical protein
MAKKKANGSPATEDESGAATSVAAGKAKGKAALTSSPGAEAEPLQEIYLNCQDPALWSGEGKGGNVAPNKPHDSSEGGLSFDTTTEWQSYNYKPELPKLGRDVSFDHRESLEGTPTRFSLDIGVLTSNEDVQWVKVTSDEGRVHYDKITKTITVPAGQRPQWRTTHVLVAGLVESLADDDLVGLTGFSCVSKGRVYLRDLRVGLPSSAESAFVAGSGTEDDDEDDPGTFTVPLGRTPRYLLPQMEGVPVSEPAIYRSLYILDTIGPAGVPLYSQDAKLWETTDGVGSVFAEPGAKVGGAFMDGPGGVCFDNSTSSSNATFRHKFLLPDTANTVSFEHSEDNNFSFLVAVTSSKRAVEWVTVTGESETPPTYDAGNKTIRLPIGRAAGWRTTRVNVADLLQRLVPGEIPLRLGNFFCVLESGGRLYFRELEVSRAGADGSQELDKHLDPFALSDEELGKAQTRPAVGVFAVHSQGWVQKGLALGNLVQSVCLAPGEVTQVAVTDWRRKTRGAREEMTQQAETVSSEIEQDRAVNEVQNAVAREAQYGGSSALSASASAQAGYSMSTLFASGSASASSTVSSAMTAQFSTGNRDLAASSSNALTQRTAEKSQALRSRRQAVVQEVSEQESEALSVRVLANYNRRHTLNIEFFEVLQMYQIETKLVGWERCLFVPLTPLDFSKSEVIKRHRTQLINIFNELGAVGLLDRMAKLKDDGSEENPNVANQQQDIAGKIGKLTEAANAISTFRAAKEMILRARGIDQGMAFRSLTDNQTNTYNNIARGLNITLPAFDSPDATTIIEALIEKERKRTALVKVSLGDVLNADRMFLSQQIWLRTSPYRFYCMLQGYRIDGQPLSMLVDPQPVGVFGNYLAFRWGFSRSVEGAQARKQFERTYLKQADSASPGAGMIVALPTSGVFAEAVLGRGEAAEVKDEFHYGQWNEDLIPILPPKIAKVTSRDRAKGMNLKGKDFASSLAALRAESLENISNIDKVLGEVGKGDMFRDMGGLAQAVSLADKVAAISGEGATKAGERTVKLHEKMLDTFVEVLNSDVGKAAVSEFMLPGSGALLLQNSGTKKGASDQGKTGDDDETDESGGDGKPDADARDGPGKQN